MLGIYAEGPTIFTSEFALAPPESYGLWCEVLRSRSLCKIKVIVMNKLLRLLRNEDGPTAVEYAVMLALIIGTCAGIVHTLAQATRENFDRSAQSIDNALNP